MMRNYLDLCLHSEIYIIQTFENIVIDLMV